MSYDDVEIEDMEWNEELQAFTYPCPCGDLFQITKEDLKLGEEIARCPSCSLYITVIYNMEDFLGDSNQKNNKGIEPSKQQPIGSPMDYVPAQLSNSKKEKKDWSLGSSGSSLNIFSFEPPNVNHGVTTAAALVADEILSAIVNSEMFVGIKVSSFSFHFFFQNCSWK
ncbi:unnamed protein product [Citrullus colocynthis]|uniref:Diphthamide biosynthesis protein 3 n=1 Tax=Citrullus colocynthis TaxID=252529 RepID=A0ABP0Y8D7_9ROSI